MAGAARQIPLAAHRTVVAGTLAFLVLGVPDGGDGVAWPFMRADLAQPLQALGVISIAVTAGAVAMSAMSGALTRSLGRARLLLVAVLLCGASLGGVAASPAWATVVLCFLAYGAGGGLIDATVQAHVVRRRGLRSMSALHAGYGVGVTVGPLLMTVVITGGLGWRAGYALLAALYLALVATLPLSWTAWRGDDEDGEATRGELHLSRAQVARSLLLFFVVTGMEVSAALWTFTFLTGARDMSTAAAGVSAGAFFALQTATRVALAAAGHRVAAGDVLRGSCACTAAGAALMLVLPGAASVAGLAAMGVGMGALYPSLMVASSGNLGERRAQSVVGWQVAAANAGAATCAAITGVVLQHLGAGRFPLVEIVAGALVLVLLLSAPRAAGARPAAG